MNPPAAPHSFRTTHWSVVQKAVGFDDASARQALAALCEAYWYPIYAFIRRSGKSPHDAEDLTQGFFARLVEKEVLVSADPAKGRFRTFLLACVRNFLTDEHDRAQAQKRGAAVLTSFDAAWAEERYATEPVDHLTPDRLFQRRWAITVLEQALQLAGEEFTGTDKGDLFAALRPFLGFGASPAHRYEELAVQFDLPVGTLKNHVFRLRQRWREILFELVGATLEDPDPEKIKDELSELLTCV